jgi:hypothetical protein
MTKRNTYTIGALIRVSVLLPSSSHKVGEWLQFPNTLPTLGYIDGRRGYLNHETHQGLGYMWYHPALYMFQYNNLEGHAII